MTKVSDLVLDEHNANKGTERGRYMLDHSLRQYGAGRSILLDKNGRIIAGNKTVEVATDVGIEDVIVVQTDGTKLVAVQRTDLDLDDGDDKARQLAYADNRASEVGLQWDPVEVDFDLSNGLDLSWGFQDFELGEILGIVHPESYSDFDTELESLEGMQEVTITITVASMYKEQVMDWLANGESLTSPGMGKGVLRRCGLL